MNWQASAGTELAVPGIAEPELESRIKESTSGAAGDWLCAWCLSHVANEQDRFPFDGKDEFTFSNPKGIRFAIITFSQTLGCRQTGTPALEFTWFPGHAWAYCQCDRCGQHLGWFYTGANDFVGLIKERIVRGLFVRN